MQGEIGFGTTAPYEAHHWLRPEPVGLHPQALPCGGRHHVVILVPPPLALQAAVARGGPEPVQPRPYGGKLSSSIQAGAPSSRVRVGVGLSGALMKTQHAE